MDNLEKYIKKHRAEFDSEEPGNKVWEGIKTSIDDKQAKTIPMTGWMWKAAAILLLVTTTLLLIDKSKQSEVLVIADEGDNSFIEEFDNAERYYLNQIEKMRLQLSSYAVDDMINKEFMTDLNNLDSLYNDLKTDFNATGSNEKIADALIQNLRIRMEIINQQLMILERIKQQTSDENIQI